MTEDGLDDCLCQHCAGEGYKDDGSECNFCWGDGLGAEGRQLPVFYLDETGKLSRYYTRH